MTITENRRKTLVTIYAAPMTTDEVAQSLGIKRNSLELVRRTLNWAEAEGLALRKVGPQRRVSGSRPWQFHITERGAQLVNGMIGGDK